MSIVTQPLASNAATSALPATSCMVLRPCVMLPTLQLPWSAGRVANVRSAAFTQNTHPAETFPVRPSGVGAGMAPSYTGIPVGTASRNVIAIGAMSKLNSSCNSAANPFQSCAIFTSPSLSIVDSLTLDPAKLVEQLLCAALSVPTASSLPRRPTRLHTWVGIVPYSSERLVLDSGCRSYAYSVSPP